MKEIFVIMISAVFVDNFVLSKFMGICPFLGVSKKLSSSLGMGAAVIFVMTCATAITYPVYWHVLVPNKLEYLNTVMPPLYNSLGVYLPLITTNCAVLGVTLLNIDNGYTFLQSVVNAVFAGVGFSLALILFSGVRSRLETADIPVTFKGIPSTLIAASIVSLSFMAFSGLIS